MGAYLTKPVTEKETEIGGNDNIQYAATSMQGWRINQEDAHNCILNFIEDWHLFAVYDGHGGAEVSKYSAMHFPDFLKKRGISSAQDIVKALEESFIDFDDVLRSEAVLKELKVISGNGENEPTSDCSDDDANPNELVAEQKMPLQDILTKYGIVSAVGRNGSIRFKMNGHEGAEDEEEDEEQGVEKKCKRPSASPQLSRAKRAKSDDKETEEGSEATEDKKENGDVVKADADGDKEDVPEATVEQGKRTTAVPVKQTKTMALAGAEDVHSSDDDDYHEGDEEEEEDDDEDEEEVEGEDEEGDDEDEEEDEDDIMAAYNGLSGGMETPGEDSGTTACVCIVAPGKAIDLSIDHKPEDDIERNRITKAGGVVNEDGRVNGGLNLSRAFGDHCYKKNRVSRNIYYLGILPLREQMICALPDVKIQETTDEDEFVVVACDGIWNSLESQQVVDFVRERITQGKTLREISEDMCVQCLADSTAGDGTGCDNMTIIIADLKPKTSADSLKEEVKA